MAGLAVGSAHVQCRLELRCQAVLLFLRLAFRCQKGLFSLGVAAVLQEPDRRIRAFRVRGLLGGPRRLGQNCQRRQRNRVCHVGFLRSLFSHVTKRRRGMAQAR